MSPRNEGNWDGALPELPAVSSEFTSDICEETGDPGATRRAPFRRKLPFAAARKKPAVAGTNIREESK